MLAWVIDIMWESLSPYVQGLLNLIILFSVSRFLRFKYIFLSMNIKYKILLGYFFIYYIKFFIVYDNINKLVAGNVYIF